MNVLFYQERPVNRWVGPYKVIAVEEKQVWLNINGGVMLASIDKVK